MLIIRIIFAIQLLFLSASLYAEDGTPDPTLLGIGLWSRPAYDGADTSQTTLIPIVRYYGQPLFARTTMGMLEGGARLELFKGFTIGTQLAYEGGRDSSESAFLSTHRFENIAPSASVGIHAEFEKNIGQMPLIALLRYRQDIDSHRGSQTDFRLIAGIYGGNQLKAGVFAQNTWADTTAAQYYYGITTQQATIAGLPAYTAQGGKLFNAYGLLWAFELNKKWMLQGSLENRIYSGDTLSSPLNQVSSNRYASLGLAYQF